MSATEERVGGTAADLPSPAGARGVGHLARWMNDPLRLLEEGARLGSVFGLQLWRKAVVGYAPEWNRFVLGDLDLFRSRGSLSQLSPYLSAGVVGMDNPAHRRRRAELNPSFHRRSVTAAFADRFAALAHDALPTAGFEAGRWSSTLVLEMLNAAFFGGRFPVQVLETFVAPLDCRCRGRCCVGRSGSPG